MIWTGLFINIVGNDGAYVQLKTSNLSLIPLFGTLVAFILLFCVLAEKIDSEIPCVLY